jgi:hypothetical protein
MGVGEMKSVAIGLAETREARIAAGLGEKSVAVLRARSPTVVREAAKVEIAGKEGADRVTHIT